MAYLVLENGSVFEGKRIGSKKNVTGELVFTSGMVGYLETLSDSAHACQIVVQTFPLIGNYGVIEDDLESSCFPTGYIVRELCHTPSNFRSQYNLEKLLCEKDICCLYDIDTRAVTKILRDCGSTNAYICDEIPSDLSFLKKHEKKASLDNISCKKTYTVPSSIQNQYNVTIIDYGTKKSIIEKLCALGAKVTVVPYFATCDDILKTNPDGIILSNGPENPKELETIVDVVKSLIGKAPILAIGLGHEVLSLAMGGKIEKSGTCHRGANIPVLHIESGRTFITNQNHGYYVRFDSVPNNATVTFTNSNDKSIEGINYKKEMCISVQFYPDTEKASHTTAFIYDDFFKMMGGKHNA